MNQKRSVRAALGVAVLTVVAVLAYAASPAAATPPRTVVLTDVGILLLPDIDCGSFVLHEDLVRERFEIATFFDAAGNPVRRDIHAEFLGAITNSSTGQSFRDPVHFKTSIDLTTGERAVAGMRIHLVRQGLGVVFADVGRIAFDNDLNVVFKAGPDAIVTSVGGAGFDPQALCTVLA